MRRGSRARPAVSYTAFSPLPGANAGRSVFCGTFRRRRSGSASPALTTGPLALRSPDFPPLPKQERPVAPLATTAKTSVPKNRYGAMYRMRPHIWQATIPWLRRTICPTEGGCTRWQPWHTQSCARPTTTGQRLVRSRS